MHTEVELVNEQTEVKYFPIQYPVSAYTFPSEAKIHLVDLDEEYIHITLTDGRKLSIPMWWIPTVYNAPREEREKFDINARRTMIIWDPEHCSINDELRLEDYLISTK